MLRFRPKLGSERSSEWRCCFCLHVRTGTILLGSWHLILHLLALGFLAAVSRDPRLLQELQRESTPATDWGDVGSVLPTPLSNVERPPNSYTHGSNVQTKEHSLIYHDLDMGALLTVCTLAITLMLIYGAARGKPAHVLPFFCLQIFDFAITVLTATGYLCYLHSIRRLVAETRRVPWRAELLQLPAPVLAFIVCLGFLAAVLVKGYWISVVWRCYKYLCMRVHLRDSLTPFVISSSVVGGGGGGGTHPHPRAAPPSHPGVLPAPDYSTLLPNYEDAVKQSPPPSYRDATLMAVGDATETAMRPGAASVPTNTVVVLPQDGVQARV